MNPFPGGQGQNPADFKLQNLTRQQLKKIQKSMKQPQFMGLLNEYMVQISDPKNKQQYDQYLRQMQKQGQLPKNMKLVQLTPHFCIRTQIVSQKNKKHNMKFFINYCSTQHLQQASCQPTQNSQGKTQFGWKVPNSMGKIRYDQDKSGTPCQVADIAFNPKCFQIINAQSSLPFRKNQFKSMIISIGLQCAQKQLGQRKQTLSKDYDILKNIKSKGGKPALLPLRYIKGKAYNKGQGPEENTGIQRNNEGRQTKLEKQLNQQKQKSMAEKQKQKQNKKDQMQEEQLEDKKVLIQDIQQGIQQPKYSTIYTYPVDYTQFMQDPVHIKSSKVPSHLTVQFKLPRVQGLQQISGQGLNVNQNRIILKIGQKYFIDLPFQTFKLKYKLITQKIKAKFDKKKKVLKVTIQVDQSVKYRQEEQKKDSLVEQIGEDLVEENIVSNNQVWKNKVLEVSQPSVDLKVIQNKQQEQQINQQPKKLIEQLDEDDQNQQQRSQSIQQNSKQPTSFDQALQQQQNKAFSLRNYYKKTTTIQPKPIVQLQQKKLQQPNIISYIFQQTNDRIVLVLKMPGYKKQEIQIVYNQQQKNNFYIQWNTNIMNENGIKQQDMPKVHLLFCKVKDQYNKDIKSVQIVFRVGFLAVFINKNVVNKFWEKTCIQEIQFKQFQLNKSDKYQLFKQRKSQVQALNVEYRKLNKKVQEQIEQKTKEDKLNDQNKQITQNIQNKQTQRNVQESSSKIDEVEQNTQTAHNQQSHKQKQQGQYFDFNNLPPQFIHFDLRFVQAMD